jgi:hypothetical protein
MQIVKKKGKKNSIEISDPFSKKNYILFLRELASNNNSTNQKYLLYYKISDKNFVETKLRTIIEVPFDRNENIEYIEFKLITIFEDTEVTCVSKFDLY